ncbi:MAG: nitroreductase family protein [Candidatus Ornithomonoglobus sp.]
MNTFETICNRKSVRSYTGECPSEEELKKILTAANAAPVGMKAYDSLVLSVITDKALLDKIDKNCRAYMNMPDIAMLYGAPMLIVVSSKLSPAPNDNTAYSNAAIIAHNMALEATELGLGSCYIWGAVFAMNSSEEILKELKLPEGYTPCCSIGLGKTDEKFTLRDIPENRIKVQFNS